MIIILDSQFWRIFRFFSFILLEKCYKIKPFHSTKFVEEKKIMKNFEQIFCFKFCFRFHLFQYCFNSARDCSRKKKYPKNEPIIQWYCNLYANRVWVEIKNEAHVLRVRECFCAMLKARCMCQCTPNREEKKKTNDDATCVSVFMFSNVIFMLLTWFSQFGTPFFGNLISMHTRAKKFSNPSCARVST